MRIIMHTLLAYLLVMNIVAFAAFGIDKWKARKGRWRTPESTLLLLAALGGSLGAWLAMWTWHHKTKHLKFLIGIPLILLAQIALAIYLICYK